MFRKLSLLFKTKPQTNPTKPTSSISVSYGVPYQRKDDYYNNFFVDPTNIPAPAKPEPKDDYYNNFFVDPSRIPVPAKPEPRDDYYEEFFKNRNW